MNNNQLAGIVSGLGNRLARRVGGSGTKGGGTNRFDIHIAEVQAQHALRSQVIDHILGQDAAERDHARSNAEAEQRHTHVTAQSLQVHQQQQDHLKWLASNAAGASDVHYQTAAGDVIKFKTKATTRTQPAAKAAPKAAAPKAAAPKAAAPKAAAKPAAKKPAVKNPTTKDKD
jgi:hypothetical protein